MREERWGEEADRAMERYAAGDETAFADVYDALAPRLLRYLRRRVPESVAGDLLQEAFLNLHRARGAFIPGARVVPWAYAIARGLLIDWLRRHRREAAVLSGDGLDEAVRAPDATADQILVALEAARRLESELARLPDPHREAFELLKLEGLSLRDAAQTLGTSVTAVKMRAHRAYTVLRAVVGSDDDKERGWTP